MVASDIPGFADVAVPAARPSSRRAIPKRSRRRSVALLSDEERRVAMGRAARALAEEQYAWPDVAGRLEEIYERVAA